VLAGVLGTAALALGLCLYGQLAASSAQRQIAGAELELKQGTGEVSDDAFEVRAPAVRDSVLVLSPPLDLAASVHGRLQWALEGLPPNAGLSLVWSTSAVPGRPQSYRPTATERAAGEADLSEQPGWSGQVGRIGLLIQGPLPGPVRIESLGLAPARGGCVTLLEGLRSSWSYREPWSQRSINASMGLEPRPFGLSAVLAVTLWVVLAILIHQLLCRRCSARARIISALFFLLLGWLALDLRWQGQLWARLAHTQETYAALDQEARWRAGENGALFALVERLRAELPAEPARVLVLSDDPGGYLSGRLRYHLLPHRTDAGLARLPNPGEVAPGDYLFVLTTVTSVDYDRANQVLSLHGRSLPVEPIAPIRGLGDLFRVRGEGA
jgi:cell division protein FtsB